MQQADIRAQWEDAALGWARWEMTVATWMEPATEAMLTMAGVDAGARVLDLASGAGSQTLRAARRVGVAGTRRRERHCRRHAALRAGEHPRCRPRQRLYPRGRCGRPGRAGRELRCRHLSLCSTRALLHWQRRWRPCSAP